MRPRAVAAAPALTLPPPPRRGVPSPQAAVAPLGRMQERGYRLASSRAYLHQYAAHGLEEGQLLAAFAGVEDTLAAYAALG
jgi:hypothetical protein